MKKIAILSFAALLFVACNSNTKQPEASTTPATETTPAPDTHTSQNSLDYKGTYKGELPTASGPGVIVTIELGNDTFKKEVTYNKDKTSVKSEGKYTWDATGSIITLEGLKDEPNKYKVGENTLTQLDMDGKEIKSESGLNYTLKKQ